MPSTILSTAAAALLLFSLPTLTSAMTDQQAANMYHIPLWEYVLHQHLILAHGVMLGFAFAVMYPLGAVIIRALKFKNVLWFHAGWQVAAYIITLAGLGIGIYLVIKQNQIMSPTGHPILGLIVIGGLLFMPVLGWVHHVVFVKRRGPSAWTYLHRYLGRILLVAGGINGGTGLWMAHDEPMWLVIAYTACAAFFFGMWFTAAVLLELVRKRKLAADKVAEEKELEVEKAIVGERSVSGKAYGGASGETSDQSSSDETMIDEERQIKVKL